MNNKKISIIVFIVALILKNKYSRDTGVVDTITTIVFCISAIALFYFEKRIIGRIAITLSLLIFIVVTLYHNKLI